MSATHETVEVTLRAWPAPKKEALDAQDLLTQVSQLTTERGHLRDITEQSLLDEIKANKHDFGAVVEDSEEREKDKPEEQLMKDRLEDVHAARIEMFKKLEFAAFHAGNAMNLVNLCLSIDPTKNLESAYTPMFKGFNIPRGSFGVDKGISLEESARAEDITLHEDLQKRREVVVKGSKMEALDWSTSSLLKAAKELEKEVRKETKYWEEILSISAKGWSLQRTRGNARNAPYAVHYGLPEANSRFKSRALAPLRMNKDGGIILDPNLRLKPKTLRVRVMENEQIIGTSRLPPQEDLNKHDIEHSIQLSRNSLFEEELFYEMSMETRQLLGYGVELRNSVIHVATPATSGRVRRRKILIDCIDQDVQLELEPNQSQSWLAQNIAEALRLLLAHEHRMRLYRRSQMPLPMVDHGRQQSSPRLLRTLIAMFSHLDTVDSLHAHIHAAVKTLKSAGLDMTLDASRESVWVKLTETIKNSENTDISATDQLLQAFVKAFDATASITLPLAGAQPESIVIATRTYIGQPVFGSEHKLSLPPSLARVLALEPDQPRQFKFSSTQDATSYLDWILALYVAHDFLANEYPGRSSTRSEDPRLTILSKGSSKGRVREDEIVIELNNGILEASAILSAQVTTRPTRASYAWNGALTHPSLKDKVKSWIT